MKWSATKPVPNNQPAKGNGMHFCFGRHTGYGGYSDYARGGRHIVIEEDKLGQSVLETWIRLEDGTISGKVTLNATFGYDQYPAVKKTKTTGSIGDISDSGVSVENKPDTTTTSKHSTATTSKTQTHTNKPKPTTKPKPKVKPTPKPKHKPKPKLKPKPKGKGKHLP